VRILRKRYKALYIVGGYAFGFATGQAVQILHAPVVASIIGFVISIAFYLIGVRTFRGPDEPLRPPRAWWRATARPTAGYWIGILALFATTSGFIGTHLRPDRFSAAHLITAAMLLLVGLYYLTSSIRLSRLRARATRSSIDVTVSEPPVRDPA
jgi:TRAP-type uncharacterized transport system fused permease subunit